MPAVRGLGVVARPRRPRGGLRAEMAAWPTIATPIAAAMNAIKGEANIVNRRRNWDSPLDASLYGNSVSRADVRRDAVGGHRVAPRLPALDAAARPALHGYEGGLKWWDLIAPLPQVASEISWDDGIDWVRIGVRHLQRRARRARRPRPRPAVDRRRPPRRQGRRGVLHAVRRRPLARAAQLVGFDRLRPDHRPRARPRLPQHDARRPHAAPEAAADGARRDGQHLLRDARRRRRAARGWKAPSGWRCSTSTSSARTRWSSTSTRGSCSSRSCSPAASAARSASASSTS